ncbi:hypothetical protein GE061_007740 [Apolygus lucorum]|uniref:Phospholipase A2-like domain-containing protein n=1 Tax=Apolygus lucorum TaxID=248454 RepID=A0A6A4JZ23_APOLU|nr:hypothetical protein GE061_007740 [Apolygus lucorum]
MEKRRLKKSSCGGNCIRGGGLINSLIDKIPIELHIPSYQFCGPGTKLEERLQRGDKGINQLDKFCKEHDIAYSESQKDPSTYKALRREADLKLEEQAWQRVKSKDANFGEKAAAWLVTTGMKAKRKLSGGGNNKRKLRRVRGGFLPLILAGLGTLGSIVGGLGTAGKAISDAKVNARRLEEEQRHNRAMEAGRGAGLYLRPYKISGKGTQARGRSGGKKNKTNFGKKKSGGGKKVHNKRN